MEMSVQQKLLIAFDLFQRGEFDKADLLAEDILTQSPRSADALHLKGVIAGLQQRHSDAESLLLAAVTLDKENHSAHFNLAKALSEQGKDKESLPWHRKALELYPERDMAWLNYGLSLYKLGELKGAIAAFDRALLINVHLAEGYTNKGNCLQAIGELDGALALHSRAIELSPILVQAWNNRGNALRDLNRQEEALTSCDRAIELKPDYAEAWSNRGVTLNDLRRYKEALASCQRAIELKPDYAEAWHNGGVALSNLRRHKEALANYERAIELKPDYVEAWSNRGVTLNDLLLHKEALASCERAIELKPDYAEAWLNSGVALNDLHRHEEALASYDRAIELKPDYAEALNNRGVPLNHLQRHEEALASYDRSIELKPDYADAWSNRGVPLNALRRHEEALASCERAIELKPDFAEALLNHGVALGGLRRHKEALASYERAIELRPNYADAYLNKSLDLLRLGDFDQGWQLYEWRWRRDEYSSPLRSFSQPLWLGGAPLGGRAIVLHSEQGFGDSIQFCRYARLVRKLGAKVVLEVEAPLVELFKTLEGGDEVVEKGAILPHFDYHCPLLSLPLAFKTAVTEIPCDVPYLYSVKAKREQWAQHLSLSRDKPSIGIVWSGNPKHKNDHNRSIRLKDICKFFSEKFHWFSLQKDVLEEEGPLLRSAGIRDNSARIKDFSDTAGLISHLDLVITVDTSAAHLAGAIGKPVWVLLPFVPDFRWMWDREDSPWYPHMRLFRQSAEGDWDTVIARVSQELRREFCV